MEKRRNIWTKGRKEGMRRLEEGMNEEMDGKKAERKRWPTKGRKE